MKKKHTGVPGDIKNSMSELRKALKELEKVSTTMGQLGSAPILNAAGLVELTLLTQMVNDALMSAMFMLIADTASGGIPSRIRRPEVDLHQGYELSDIMLAVVGKACGMVVKRMFPWTKLDIREPFVAYVTQKYIWLMSLVPPKKEEEDEQKKREALLVSLIKQQIELHNKSVKELEKMEEKGTD